MDNIDGDKDKNELKHLQAHNSAQNMDLEKGTMKNCSGIDSSSERKR